MKQIFIGKQIQISLNRANENQLVFILIAVSVVLHLLAMIVDTSSLSSPSKALFEEWEIEASLLPDDNLSFPAQSALPDSKKAEEAKVAKNILPQLPKKFAIKESDETISEGVGEKANKKVSDKPKAKDKELVPTKSDPKEANKIAQQEALKRLAKEKLRLEKKFADSNQALKNSSIARLKKEKESEDKLSAGAMGFGKEENIYRAKLTRSIRRCNAIPPGINLSNADIYVTIGIVINHNGELLKSRITAPSGDIAFDTVTHKAVQDCVSHPKPPSSLANKEILLRFSPKSF